MEILPVAAEFIADRRTWRS